jgi:hypothetical protein
MVQRSCLTALSLLLCVAASSPAADSLDLIPADALGGVACRSIDGLVQKSEKLVKDAEIKLPATPSVLCTSLFTALGIQNGLDRKGGCSLVVVNKKHIGAEIGFGNLEQYLVAALPFSDLDAMAGNFGIDKGKLKPETMTTIMGRRPFGKLCYARGKHLYLGANEKAILSVARGKTVGADLTPARRKALAEADCLCHLGTEVWGDIWKDILRQTEQSFRHVKDGTERQTVQQLMQTLTAVRHVFCTCKLDDGFGCGCVCVFPREGNEAAKKFLTSLRGGEGSSSLKGLPAGNVVAATATRSDGSRNRPIGRVLIELFLRDVLETNRIFGAADRPAILATFNEIWPHLKGTRFALYKTANEQKLGLFSLVGILDVDDADGFLTDLKALAKLGSADGLDLTSEAGKEKTAAEIEQLIKDLGHRRFQKRESATARLLLAGEQVLPYLEKGIQSKDLETSRRAERIKQEMVQAAQARRKELLSGNLGRAVKPSLVFLDKKERLEGFDVYQIAVKLTKRDAATAPQFRQLLGPEWARVRLGVQGKQVVVLVGSDTRLLSTALSNVKDEKSGLSSAAALAGQSKQIDGGRKFEFHVSLAAASALVKAADLEKPGKLPAQAALTTVALTVEEDRVQCDLWMPVPELRAVNRSVR